MGCEVLFDSISGINETSVFGITNNDLEDYLDYASGDEYFSSPSTLPAMKILPFAVILFLGKWNRKKSFTVGIFCLLAAVLILMSSYLSSLVLELHPQTEALDTSSDLLGFKKTLNHFELDLLTHRRVCRNGDVSKEYETAVTQNVSSWPRVITYRNPEPDPVLVTSRVKFLALYFPQWYPAPENGMKDDWRYFQNPNFTQNKARVPMMRPRNHLYYDPRCYGLRKTQAALAKKYLLDGFVYYFYFFGGSMLLPEVNERMLVDGEPDTDFAFMWVNVDFGPEPAIWDSDQLDGLARTLFKFFSHPRYIRVDQRPVLYIYTILPEHVIEELIRCIVALGSPRPYVVTSIQWHNDNFYKVPYADAYAEFPPNSPPIWLHYGYTKYNHTRDYHLGLNINFDNTPRISEGDPNKLPEELTKSRPLMGTGPQPAEFLDRCIARVNAWSKRQAKEKAVLIFAWNEWSEQG